MRTADNQTEGRPAPSRAPVSITHMAVKLWTSCIKPSAAEGAQAQGCKFYDFALPKTSAQSTAKDSFQKEGSGRSFAQVLNGRRSSTAKAAVAGEADIPQPSGRFAFFRDKSC